MRQILLVDDDDLFRKMLMLKLTHWGFNVIEARNGKEALRIHHKLPPEVVLTDLVMPEKEGLETIEELRRTHSAARIIAMSGGGRMAGPEYLKIASLMGAHYTLKKPFADSELRGILDQIYEVELR